MKPERQIRRTKCESCNGNGFHLKRSKQSCHSCHGSGWVESEKFGELICQNCNGDGFCKINDKIQCDHCHGKGYFVKIFEIIHTKTTCPSCCGKGEIASICPKCKNEGYYSGIIYTEDYECDYCSGTGIAPIRGGGIKCSYCDGVGYSETMIECDSCVINKCKTCNGSGKVEHIHESDITPSL